MSHRAATYLSSSGSPHFPDPIPPTSTTPQFHHRANRRPPCAAAPIPSPPSMESSQPANPATRIGLLPILPPPSRGFFSSNLSLPPVPLAGARRCCRGFGAALPLSLVRGRCCPDPAMADLFHTFRRPPDLPPCCSRPRPPSHAMDATTRTFACAADIDWIRSERFIHLTSRPLLASFPMPGSAAEPSRSHAPSLPPGAPCCLARRGDDEYMARQRSNP